MFRNSCPECAARVSAKDAHCRNCGAQLQSFVPRDFDQQLMQERLRTIEYERRRFGLLPRLQGESDVQYLERIDREKTPKVVERCLINICPHNASLELTDD